MLHVHDEQHPNEILMKQSPSFAERLVQITETILTLRERRRARLRAKAARRGPVLDWIAAIGSAMIWVLVINQYVFQAYAIPSPSMEPTLMVGDRLFVDKLSFGPELLPGYGKLPAVRTPRRGEIVVFESPEYTSRGPVFETLNRIVFMATLSMVNLDKDENGEDRAQFLIKRNVGEPGDIVRIDPSTGGFLIRPAGDSRFVRDRTLLGEHVRLQTLIDPNRGDAIRDMAQYTAEVDLGVSAGTSPGPRTAITSREAYSQVFAYWYYRTRMLADPSSDSAVRNFSRLDQGIYVPEDRFLPLGDNRDNSHDGRYFGPVQRDTLLGTPLMRFWPLTRIGAPD